MFDKRLFERICKVECSFAELRDFVAAIDQKEFDTAHPFETYYRVETIVCAIEKYQKKQIDARYLACWANAYNWIVMGGFQIKKGELGTPLKEFLIWDIADWLDSLSFFDDSDEWYDLEAYKQTFTVLDSVLHDLERWDAVYSDHGCNEGYVVVLVKNDAARYFVRLYGETGDTGLDGIDKIEERALEKRAEQLAIAGYRELTYGYREEK